jgi:ubiquinone/menaquinone biosynthesis C-methylase UbiE
VESFIHQYENAKKANITAYNTRPFDIKVENQKYRKSGYSLEHDFLPLIHNNMNLLDIGCGRGKFLNMVKVPKTGIDLSQKNLKIVKEMQGLSALSLIVADAENLPIKDSCIDFIHFSSTLHHIPNYLKTLKDSIRILRNHGLLYFSESNRVGLPFLSIIEKFARVRGHYYEFHSGINLFQIFSLFRNSNIFIYNHINAPIRFDGSYFPLWYHDQLVSVIKSVFHSSLKLTKFALIYLKKFFSLHEAIIERLLPKIYKTWIQALFIKRNGKILS